MRIVSVLLLATAAALLVSPAAYARAETIHFTERIPFDVEAFSECTGEGIEGEGTMLVNSQITFDGAGGAHFHLTLTLQDVSGVTASGERIRFVSTDVFQDNFNSSLTWTFTSNLNQLGVVQGPHNNFFLDFTFHSTFHVDEGKVTGVVSNVRFGCR